MKIWRNYKETKFLKELIKSLPDEVLIEILYYPSLFQSFYTDVGAPAPSLDKIRKYLGKEAKRRLFKMQLKDILDKRKENKNKRGR